MGKQLKPLEEIELRNDMGLAYENLDPSTRQFMLEEIDMDVQSGAVYTSSYLNPQGCTLWPTMLRQAAETGSDDTLSQAITTNACLHEKVERRKPKGGTTWAAVPYTASQTLGEGEFNRYYARGLCRRAIAEGFKQVQVYRAKAVAQPRFESQAKVGTFVDPALILADLRATQGVEPALGLPQVPIRV